MKPFASLMILLGLTVGSAGLTSCGTKAESTTKPMPKSTEAIPVKVMTVASASFADPVMASGQFSTNDESYLSFKIGGVISKVLVSEGQTVTKGQVLATLDPTEINAQVQQAELGLKKAERDLQRAEALFKDSVATLEQVQNARTQVEVVAEQVKAARFNQQYAVIRAVKAGKILRKMANEGQVVSPGTSVLQTNGSSQAEWVLKVGLSDKDWARIKIGDQAEVSIDAQPNQVIKATVSEKASFADPYTGMIQVELKVNEPQVQLATGLFGKATIRPAQAITAMAIPYQALMDGDGNSGFVFVSRDQKTATKVPVTVLGLDKSTVRIVADLLPTDQLIVEGSPYLNEGSQIKIVK